MPQLFDNDVKDSVKHVLTHKNDVSAAVMQSRMKDYAI